MSVITVPQSNAGAGSPVGQFPANAVAVTPSDTNTYSSPVSVYVGVAGDVAIVPWSAGSSGTSVVFKNMPAGSVVPCQAIIINATSTTATNLVAVS